MIAGQQGSGARQSQCTGTLGPVPVLLVALALAAPLSQSLLSDTVAGRIIMMTTGLPAATASLRVSRPGSTRIRVRSGAGARTSHCICVAGTSPHRARLVTVTLYRHVDTHKVIRVTVNSNWNLKFRFRVGCSTSSPGPGPPALPG